MAKVKFSGLISEMRGKINGSVFTRNRVCNALRTKITPINRRSTDQMTRRVTFGGLARAFQGLTDAQIAAWNALASETNFTNIFGDKFNPTGLNLYIECNANLALIGESLIDDPPANFDCDAITMTSIDFDTDPADVATITASLATVPAGHKAVICATPQFSPGISFYRNKLRVLEVVDAAGDLAARDILALYNAKFGTLVQGKKVACSIYLVAKATGAKRVVKFKAGSDTASKVK